MRLILHVGMHKTGSTSIQNNLHGFTREGFEYFEFLHPNHSNFYNVMFRRRSRKGKSRIRDGRPLEETARLQRKFEKLFDDAIATSRAKHIVSSAEGVCTLTVEELRDLKRWCDARFEHTRIVCYVRPPETFMASRLQQQTVGGVLPASVELYPNYRHRLEKFAIVFGRENVEFILFERGALFENDVVCDFARRCGFHFDKNDVRVANESKSLETTSVLAARIRLGRDKGRYEDEARQRRIIANKLDGLGGTKFSLSKAFVLRELEGKEEDLAWISDRLGEPVSNVEAYHVPDGNAEVSSVDDLLSRSVENFDALLDIIRREAARKRIDARSIASLADVLADVLRCKNKGAGAPAIDREQPARSRTG